MNGLLELEVLPYGLGIPGTPGTLGTSGIPGTLGTSGIPGTSGILGTPGTSGTFGIPGTSGIGRAGKPGCGRDGSGTGRVGITEGNSSLESLCIFDNCGRLRASATLVSLINDEKVTSRSGKTNDKKLRAIFGANRRQSSLCKWFWYA